MAEDMVAGQGNRNVLVGEMFLANPANGGRIKFCSYEVVHFITFLLRVWVVQGPRQVGRKKTVALFRRWSRR